MGNYVEERAMKELPAEKPVFSGISEAHERYGAQVCSVWHILLSND
jgi:hypothetical protein